MPQKVVRMMDRITAPGTRSVESSTIHMRPMTVTRDAPFALKFATPML